jgi:hypothetical protein
MTTVNPTAPPGVPEARRAGTDPTDLGPTRPHRPEAGPTAPEPTPTDLARLL